MLLLLFARLFAIDWIILATFSNRGNYFKTTIEIQSIRSANELYRKVKIKVICCQHLNGWRIRVQLFIEK